MITSYVLNFCIVLWQAEKPSKWDFENAKWAVPEAELNATFADLPAPQLEWEEMLGCPVPRLDGSAIQIKNLLYVLSGYGTIEHVTIHIFSRASEMHALLFVLAVAMNNGVLLSCYDGILLVYLTAF